ncbi:MAG: ATP synthase F1 subunit gamma [Erysipelotrichaceae bacterium]|jgi:F-type H+-transporting ATPase subunit gamma|nr:ATP synthase F1 subunit gamma [Erysipelotrichaceae bacterium]MBQ1304476.1 ATP synthase F1 subunit gamma [Erysipelotrichaceae bacterium]MBQ1757447.1 ATP synthase F1 subunit gamma [Erysipelotrichaceae bacterium]MBQ2685325.1 ATP synthase F1 subunit gamma [Erysipelotrichaceae bacterium]MBR2792437.1 ATP synthase F1 subunit gamma [Erysipelotrichaceae bacterium]
MAGQISNIRRQLRSVRSTQKITNAMALVATAKLQKQKGIMAENNEYASAYQQMILAALSAKNPEQEINEFFIDNGADNPLHIIITSNSGLCGSYNMDLLRYVEKYVSKEEPIFSIGAYGTKWLYDNEYMVIKSFPELENMNPTVLNRLIDNVITLYQAREISYVDIIYTEYVNTLNFEPSTFQLLPLHVPEGLEEKDIELAPDRQTVLNELIPRYINSVVYSTFLEAKTSEHAARRSAMDSANTNAKTLIDHITLEYNQARQAVITQEVNEITAGADAL